MNVLGQFLDDRAGPPRTRAEAAREARKQSDILWMNKGVSAEERLLYFDRWARKELEMRLDWAWAGAQREKRVEQARVCLEKIALDLFKRGWMIDGRPLADRITKMLDGIAKQQKAGRVLDFWPYFQASVARYVGSNAEELKEEAMRAGTHIHQFLYRQSKGAGASLPELIAQRKDEITKEKTLREKLAEARRAKKMTDNGPTLPGL